MSVVNIICDVVRVAADRYREPDLLRDMHPTPGGRFQQTNRIRGAIQVLSADLKEDSVSPPRSPEERRVIHSDALPNQDLGTVENVEGASIRP